MFNGSIENLKPNDFTSKTLGSCKNETPKCFRGQNGFCFIKTYKIRKGMVFECFRISHVVVMNDENIEKTKKNYNTPQPDVELPRDKYFSKKIVFRCIVYIIDF